MADLIPAEEINKARERIRPFLRPTPLVKSEYFSKKFGAEIYLKLETVQPTHTFKVRGAINAIVSIPEDKRARGVITASGGNHGLGVAYAAQLCDIPARVYLPEKTPEIKVEALRDLGADIVMYGDAWDDANAKAMEEAQAYEVSYIHPFNDQKVMAGQGTIVLETLNDLKDPDYFVASIGGGGLICGIISAARHFHHEARVAGVETEGADCMSQSVYEQRMVTLPKITSIADSLGAKKTERYQYELVGEFIDELAVVSDEATKKAVLELLQEEKLLAEPAAACCLAAIAEEKLSFTSGMKVVVVVCGGNIGTDKIMEWQNGT